MTVKNIYIYTRNNNYCIRLRALKFDECITCLQGKMSLHCNIMKRNLQKMVGFYIFLCKSWSIDDGSPKTKVFWASFQINYCGHLLNGHRLLVTDGRRYSFKLKRYLLLKIKSQISKNDNLWMQEEVKREYIFLRIYFLGSCIKSDD